MEIFCYPGYWIQNPTSRNRLASCDPKHKYLFAAQWERGPWLADQAAGMVLGAQKPHPGRRPWKLDGAFVQAAAALHNGVSRRSGVPPSGPDSSEFLLAAHRRGLCR
jgi:hypothetical protein